MVNGLGGERQWQQVVDMATGGAVAQVFAVQLHLVQVEEGTGLCQQGAIQWIRTAQRQRQAVAGQRVALAELAQRGAVCTADADPVVGETSRKSMALAGMASSSSIRPRRRPRPAAWVGRGRDMADAPGSAPP